MLKHLVIAGAAAAVVLGAGTAALAASGSTTAATPGSTTAAGHPAAAGAKAAHRSQLTRALHAQWVTRDGKSTTKFSTHDAIRGSVTAVSASSITVKAADGVSQTYAVTGTTKVHTRAAGKGKTAAITGVHTGDKVRVLGTGTSTLTATRVADATK